MVKQQSTPQSPITAAEREAMASEMEAVLRRHVMEAWFPRSVDTRQGGFSSDFDRRWRPGPDTDRMLEFQGRQTRSAAKLAIAYPAEGQWAEYALHGFRYLRDVMWDAKHGGWYWKVDRSGGPLVAGTKHAHSISYAMQACAITYAATGDSEARALASEAFTWFDSRAHDAEYGGYHAWLTREGKVIRDAAGVPAGAGEIDPLGHDVGLKDVNYHGDWFEALNDLVAIMPDDQAQARLAEFAGLYLDRITTTRGELHFAFQVDWMPVPQPERYGYGMQAIQRFFSADARLEERDRLLTRTFQIADHLVERAWTARGGFWYAGAAGVPDELEGVSLTLKRRIWWVQLEALRALATLVARDPDNSRFTYILRRQWAFVRDEMTDPVYGGFYVTCPRDLRRAERPLTRWQAGPALNKGNQWKDAAHETDALLSSIAALRGGPGKPEPGPRTAQPALARVGSRDG